MQRFGRQFDRGVKQVLWLHGWLRSSTTATTLLLLVQSALAAVTASQVPVSQVTAADVVAAMTRQHLPAERVQVVFPASITATVDTPVLDVAQATMRDAKSANLRMVCAVHGECPSFYVVVRWAQAPGSIATEVANMSPRPSSLAPTQGPSQTLRAGAHATLLIDQEKVHIRLPVVCAQSGSVGDRIRVITPNRRQTFEAVVLTDTEVQGSL